MIKSISLFTNMLNTTPSTLNESYNNAQLILLASHSTRGERNQVQKNARTKGKSKTNPVSQVIGIVKQINLKGMLKQKIHHNIIQLPNHSPQMKQIKLKAVVQQ